MSLGFLAAFTPLSVGSHAYAAALRLNRYVNAVRRMLGYRYWSLAAFLKHKVKNAVNYIANFERALAVEARRRGVDGVICGHIHQAEITEIDGILYCNDSDSVESCTTLVEDFAGQLSLLRWTETTEVLTGTQALPLMDTAHRSGRMKVALVAGTWLPQTDGVAHVH